MPKLLALDLSSNVGHAVMERGSVPRFGTLRLTGDRARQLGSFLHWLSAYHGLERFDGLAWERPLLMRTDTVDKLELLYGLAGVAYAFAGYQELPWREVTVQDAKIALTGRGTAKKPDMIAAAMNDLNWKVADDHQADAGAVGLVAYDRIWPKARAA